MMKEKFKKLGILFVAVAVVITVVLSLQKTKQEEKKETTLQIPAIFKTKPTATYSIKAVVGETSAVNKIVTDPIYNQMTITSVDSKNTAICQIVSYLVGNKRYVLVVPTGKGTTTIRVTGKYNKKTYGYDIKTQVTNPNNVKVGVDLSSYQGKIEADVLKKAGTNFAIVRAGHGYSTEKNFSHFIKECQKDKIDLGLYWYLSSKDNKTLITDQEVLDQANAFVKLLKENKLTSESLQYPIYLDLESDTLYGNVPEVIKIAYVESLAREFFDVLAKAGYKNVGIYANKSYYETYLSNAYFASIKHKWYARYGYVGTKPTITLNNQTFTPDMWQIGDNFKIQGISKERIDLNYYYLK